MHKRELPFGGDRFKLFSLLGGEVIGCDTVPNGNPESIADIVNRLGSSNNKQPIPNQILPYKIDKSGFPVIQPTKRTIYDRVKKYYLALIENGLKEQKNKISELENEKYEIEFPNNLIYRLLSGKDVRGVLLKDLQVEYRGSSPPNFIKRIMGREDKSYNVFAMGIDVTQYMPDKECEKMHRKRRELTNAVERYDGIRYVAGEFAGGFDRKKNYAKIIKDNEAILKEILQIPDEVLGI